MPIIDRTAIAEDDDPDPPHSEIRLTDGRALSWAEYGDPAGAPLFFHHGIPSSRLAAAVLADAALRNRVRLIAPERPGFGYSDPLPERRITDWPSDLKQLADHLQLDTFSVTGISAGAPYTLACALQMPERLDRVALISGLGRIDDSDILEGMSYEWRLIYTLFLKSRRLASLWMRGYGRAARKQPDRVVAEQIKRMPPVDGAILGSEQITANRIADLRQAFRQGPAAAGIEALRHMEPWGFDFKDVQFPVLLWQGKLDESHPIQMGRRIAAELPTCQPIFVDGVGSLGFVTHADAIFGALFPERAAPAQPSFVYPEAPLSEGAPASVDADGPEGLPELLDALQLDVLPDPLPGESGR